MALILLPIDLNPRAPNPLTRTRRNKAMPGLRDSETERLKRLRAARRAKEML
jgi:hypothetical protein